MDYQIIAPGDDDPAAGAYHRVRIDGAVYPLRVTGGAELEPRQLAFVERGEYGPLAQAYLAASRAAGYSPRFNWRGIVNELGDHASVTPPRPISPPA